MGRLTSNKGFLLAELCIVLMGISILTCICIPAHEFASEDFWTLRDAYLCAQSEAILSDTHVAFDTGCSDQVHFNGDGNVNQARTLKPDRHHHRIVIELGGGRLVEKE